jgi:uroporphyrinogen III methyltransferase / synthase
VRIIVVRSARQAGALAGRLEGLGHEVVECPLIEIEPLGDAPLDLAGYDWLVVTSPNGADELGRRGMTDRPRVAAIGRGTADALAAHGIAADLVATVSTQEGLLAEFPADAGRVLVAAADGARRTLAATLGADFLPLYRTVELTPDERPSGDLAVLASSSQARAFARLGLEVPVVSIGPQTTETARGAGLRVIEEADPHDLGGLVAAVERVTAQ